MTDELIGSPSPDAQDDGPPETTDTEGRDDAPPVNEDVRNDPVPDQGDVQGAPESED